MYPTSDRLNQIVRYPHKIVSAVHVYSSSGVVLKDDLKLEAGFVRVDDGREVRRRATLRLMDYTGSLTPREAFDLLHPLSSHELRVYRGVRFPDGTEELVPQGVFDIADVNITDSRENFDMEVTGYDRARGVRRRRFITNYIVELGTNCGTAIKDMITSTTPGTEFDFVETTFTTPRLVFGGSGETGGGNAWDAAQKIAESIGMELFFDVNGVCVMREVPSLDRPYVHWHYHETEDDPSMTLYVDRRMTNEDTFNHVIVFGESSSNTQPAKGEAIDDDTGSPTYIYGPYGDIPTFIRSPLVRYDFQATTMAEAILRSKLGVEETVRVTGLVHPGHEIGDVIHIKRDRSGIDTNCIIDQFTMPLEAAQALNVGVRTMRTGKR